MGMLDFALLLDNLGQSLSTHGKAFDYDVGKFAIGCGEAYCRFILVGQRLILVDHDAALAKLGVATLAESESMKGANGRC